MSPRKKLALLVLITIAAAMLMLLTVEGIVRVGTLLKYGSVRKIEDFWTEAHFSSETRTMFRTIPFTFSTPFI